jgi:hypothetical protein
MRRANMIRLRASDAELAQLTANAQDVGLSLSAYLRWRGLQQTNGASPRAIPTRRTTKKNQRRRSR